MKKLSILLVDDAQDFAEVLGWHMREAGHTVVYAANGKDGAAFLAKVRFDLVITDIILPEMDGLELIETIKKDQPEALILAISGGGKFYAAQTCLEAVEKREADAILLKPFGPEMLMQTVEKMFSKRPA